MRRVNITPEEIKNLYWEKKVSLRGIAKKFNVCMGTIRKIMVRNNIPRRLSKKHEVIICKEELKKLYSDDKIKIEKIIKKYNVSLSTLYRWMKIYNINPKRRMKYKKYPFSGDNKEKAYLEGLRYGDLSSNKQNRLINIELGTTHSSMMQLFYEVFQKYGTVCKYPRYNKITKRYGWKIYILLDDSFKFLLYKKKEVSDDNFYDFLAGFFDCEGCLFIYNNKGYIGLSALIYNNDKQLLIKIYNKLKKDGFNPKFYKIFKKGGKTGDGYYRKEDTFALALHTNKKIIQFIKKIPIKHSEKIRKANIILNLPKNSKWEDISSEVLILRNQIKRETEACVIEAMNNVKERDK